jgi:hypothetical protein
MVETMLLQTRSYRRRAIVVLAVLVPPLYIMALLIRYGVNAPFWDQWELVTQIQKLHQGTLTLGDLWSQHNEHRILVPRLIMLGLGMVTGWNIIGETYVSLVVAVGSTGLLVAILWQTVAGRLGRRLTFVLTGFVVWMMLSPVQWQNWLWSWQIAWFLSVLGVTATIWLISQWPGRWPVRLRLWAAGGAAIIATYSLASGMFVWPIGLAMLVLRREPRSRWLGWTIAGAAVIASYYVGYSDPPSHPSKALFLHRPKQAIEYLFVYLGRPLGVDLHMTMVLGGALFMLFLVATGYLLVRHRQGAVDLIAWWALATYGLISAATTAVGRVGLGVEQGFASRYSTVSTLFTIATLVLVVQAVKIYYADTRQQDSPPTAIWFLVTPVAAIAVLEYLRAGVTTYVMALPLTLFFLVIVAVIVPSLALGRRLHWLEPVSGYRVILGLFLAGTGLLVLSNYVDGTRSVHQWHGGLRHAQQCLRQAQSADDPCLTQSNDNPTLWPRLQYLRQIHWGGF